MAEFIFPCPDYTGVSSGFGYRDCPFHGYEFHQGVDFSAPLDSDILAARTGAVVAAGYDNHYGYTILLDHGGGIRTKYGHASSLLVGVGDKVLQGDKIALAGSTGQSVSNHLHFEIFLDGAYKNPLNYVRKNNTAHDYNTAGYGNSRKKEDVITTAATKEVYGSAGEYKFKQFLNAESGESYSYSIMIENDKIYLPVVTTNISYTSERNSHGCLKFNVLKTAGLNFTEGNPVCLQLRGQTVFYGYIFSKSRQDKDMISVTAYDQLRYLKNKDTFVYSNKSYSDLVRMAINDFGLSAGEISDTGFCIPRRTEEGTVMDMLLSASDLTYENTGELFVLYDDCGKICLKNSDELVVPVLIDESSASGFSYTSTIDSGVFNRIKLAADNDDAGVREIYLFNDAASQENWGVLQHYERISDPLECDFAAVGQTLLGKLNRKRRILSIQGCFGDHMVRGGCKVCVNLNVGDLVIDNFMTVERVTHRLSDGRHFMDIECEQF